MNNTLNILGLSFRANKAIIGSDKTIDAIKNNKVSLIFLDKMTSSNIEKQLIKLCDLNNIPLIRNFTQDELSKALGKTNIKVVSITDEGFKNIILKSLN